MVVKDIYDVLRPIHILSKWTSVSAYSLKGNPDSPTRGYIILKKDIAIDLMFVLSLIALFVYSRVYCLNNFLNVSTFSTLIQTTEIVVIQLSVLFVSHVYRNKFFNLMKTILKVNNQLKLLPRYTKDYNKLRCVLLYYMLYKYSSSLIIVSLTAVVFYSNNGDKSMLCILEGCTAFYTYLSFDCYIYCFVHEIKQLFFTINSNIEALKEEHHKRHENVTKKLRVIFKMYLEIKSLAKELNHLYEPYLMCKIVLLSIDILTMSFKISIIDFSSTSLDMSHLLMIYQLIYVVIDTVVMVHNFSNAEDEGKRTLRLMEDVQNTVGRANLAYKQVELISLQVYVEDFKFNAYGFFPLDWTLLHSMIAGITTYLVILHQFSNMEK